MRSGSNDYFPLFEYFLPFTVIDNNMKQKSRIPVQPLRSGQIWQMGDSNLHIELVGKTLVHYKLHKGATKRTPISLSGKDAVEKYLKKNKAILVQE